VFTGPGRISFDARLTAFYEKTLAKLNERNAAKS
jgi:hypothetical protein